MTALNALFSFRGRLRRRDFWLRVLAMWLVYVAIIAAGGVTMPHIWQDVWPGRGRLLTALAGLPVFLWMSLALLAKRFHDRGRAMFDILHAFFPIRGWIWGVAECCGEGTKGDNRFGPSPKPVEGVEDLF